MHPAVQTRIEGPRGCGYRRPRWKLWTIPEIESMASGVTRKGYVIVYPPGGGRYRTATWEFKHRIVMESTVGRRLLDTEDVHHVDEDKSNNDPGNLEILSCSDHGRLHSPLLGENVPCAVCGSMFYLSRAEKNRGRMACSVKCGAKLPGAKANHARNLTGRKTDRAVSLRIVKLRDSGLTWKQVAEQSGVTYAGCRDRYERTKERK